MPRLYSSTVLKASRPVQVDAAQFWRVPIHGRVRRWTIVRLVILLLLALPLAILAQAADHIVISYPQAVEGEDSLRLNVYFTVVDALGAPVPEANLDRAGILQIVGDNVIYEADVSPADSPIFIALVLDASGSMSGAMDELRQAAVAAIESAPQQASLAVYQFNIPDAGGQTLQPLHDFSADHEAVKAGVGALQSANAGTCIYYAAVEAVEAVARAAQDQPEARRAVILFTDGYDELTTGRRDTCSANTTVDDVVAAARAPAGNPAAPVPLYTIGMAGENPVDETTLRRFAAETGGLTAIGGQADLSDRFQQIMSGLANQWLATAEVRPAAGDHQATLVVRTSSGPDGAATEMSQSFAFQSTRDYSGGEPSVYRATWIDAENRFRINVINPAAISRLELLLLKEEGGEVETLRLEPLDGGAEAHYVAPTLDRLEAGRRYRAEVYAYDQSGAPITRNDSPVLATVDFAYEPPAAPPAPTPAVRIVDVIADPSGRTLTINLDALNTEQVDRYRIALFNESAGVAVPSFTARPDENGRLVIDLEQAGVEPGAYRVGIVPLDEAGQPLLAQEIAYPYQVAYAPREASLGERLGLAFRENPWIPGLILAFIAGLIAFLAFSYLRSRRSSSITFRLEDTQNAPQSPLRKPTRLAGLDRDGPPEPVGGKVPATTKPVEKPPPAPAPGVPGPAPATDKPAFTGELAGAVPFSPAGNTVMGDPTFVALPGEEGDAAAAQEPVLRLRVVESPDESLVGQEFVVDHYPYTIGRVAADLALDDRRVSRAHARIDVRDGKLYLTDLGSSNGTTIINTGQKLQARMAYELSPGRLQLRLGGTVLEIEYGA